MKKVNYDYCDKCKVKIGYWEDDKTYIEISHKCGKKQSEIEVKIERTYHKDSPFISKELEKLISEGQTRKGKLILED